MLDKPFCTSHISPNIEGSFVLFRDLKQARIDLQYTTIRFDPPIREVRKNNTHFPRNNEYFAKFGRFFWRAVEQKLGHLATSTKTLGYYIIFLNEQDTFQPSSCHTAAKLWLWSWYPKHASRKTAQVPYGRQSHSGEKRQFSRKCVSFILKAIVSVPVCSNEFPSCSITLPAYLQHQDLVFNLWDISSLCNVWRSWWNGVWVMVTILGRCCVINKKRKKNKKKKKRKKRNFPNLMLISQYRCPLSEYGETAVRGCPQGGANGLLKIKKNKFSENDICCQYGSCHIESEVPDTEWHSQDAQTGPQTVPFSKEWRNKYHG